MMKVVFIIVLSLLSTSCIVPHYTLIGRPDGISNKTLYTTSYYYKNIGQGKYAPEYKILKHKKIIYLSDTGYAYILSHKDEKLIIARSGWSALASPGALSASLCWKRGMNRVKHKHCYEEVTIPEGEDYKVGYVKRARNRKEDVRFFVVNDEAVGDKEKLQKAYAKAKEIERQRNFERQIEMLRTFGYAISAIKFFNDPEKATRDLIAIETMKAIVSGN